MRTHQKPAVLLWLLLATAALSQATTVFNDTFVNGSTIGAASNPAAAGNATSYAVASSKNSANTIAADNLKLSFTASTTSGFMETQARFTDYPVTLTNVGDQITLTTTFKATTNIISGTAANGSYLCVGLFSSGSPSVAPLTNLANSGLSATASSPNSTGGVQLWQGYVSRINANTFSSSIITRPAQSGVDTSSQNQDLIGSNWGGGAFDTPAGASLGTLNSSSALTDGATYTSVYKIELTAAGTNTITSTIYSGVGTGGAVIFNQSANATATNFLTSSFDGLTLGFRYSGVSVAGVIPRIDINSFNIVTNAATTILPVIETAPFAQTRSVGENVDLSVVANGGGATVPAYQWYKDDVAITLGENATARSATLNFASALLTDTASYKVAITNTAGTVTSTPVLLTITDGPIPPTIVTEPTGATVLVGGSKTFSVSAYGTATLIYQWEFSTDGGNNYTPIDLATGSSYEITSALPANAGHYRCVVTNDEGSDTSAPAILTVNQAPEISTQPVGATLNVGDPLTLSVIASGTPTPTYQWKKNGVNISGATNPTYFVGSATGADTGGYTVVVTNSVTSVTSSAAAVAVLSSTLATSALSPASAASDRNPDTRLVITFNAAVTAGVTGFLRIHDASNDAVVDTIDFAAAAALRASLSPASTLNLPVQNQSIGGVTNFNYYPLTVSGNTVTIYPRNGTLTYGKSYYVKIDTGAFVNASGESFAGISSNSTWTFGTKAAGPAAAAATLTVAANGTGDFDTVQGALDWVPSGNVVPRTIFIRNGSYFEQVVFTNKHFLTLLGEDRTQTAIVYPNNNSFNNVSGFYHRSTFIGSNVHDTTIANLKFHNTTPQGGSQAESFILSGSGVFTGRNIVTKCNFHSYQDTIQINRQCYISDCYIEGDTDFIWGNGPAFFSNCDIKILRTGGYVCQTRNDSGNHGYVFSNCRFTAGSGFTGNYLNRIDPKSTGFPFSEVVLLNCRIGDATNNAFLNTTIGANGSDYRAAWWLLNGTTSPTTDTANIHNWDHNTTDGTGAPLGISGGPAFTVMPTDSTTIANYSDPFWVLNSTWAGVVTGSWTPSMPLIFLAQPQGKSVSVVAAAGFSADVAAVPGATWQWYLNDAPINGATASSHLIPAAGGGDWGTYKVIATSASVGVTSDLASLTPVGAPIPNPTADTDGDGSNDLTEYSFGTNPASGSSGSITYAAGVVGAHGQPVVNIPSASEFNAVFGRRNNYLAAGLTYTVQFSASLGVWVNSTAIPTVLATDGEIDAVSVPYPATITTPAGEEQPKFFRVGVSSN